MNCLPNLYVPGFPKSATTSISRALAKHSRVFAPITAEPHYWASDMPFYAAREGLDSISSYRALYHRATAEHQWRLDGSTLYLYSDVAATSIVRKVPEARFIVCLRAPEEIVPAWHMQMLNGRYESEQDPERAFNLSERRRQGRCVPKHCPDARLLDYERIASIGTQLSRLLSTVDACKVHVVTLSSVMHDPVLTLEGCWRFLGIPSEPSISLGKNNTAFSVRHQWLRRSVYHPRVKPYVTKVLNTLPTQVGEQTRGVFRGLMYQKADRAPTSKDFRAFLREFYSDERRLLRASMSGVSGAPALEDPHHKALFG